MAAELNEATTKLVEWLREAHAKESELEAALTAHIGVTEKQAYKKRLRTHLTETREHKRRVTSRIKQLGGSVDASLPEAVVELAGKTIAAAKGGVDALRAAVTQQAETHLRNAQDELREEHVEIALYTRIETFATEVGDTDTARLARAIRRDEERMAKYLDGELVRLVKDVVKADVPPALRRRSSTAKTGSRSRASTAARAGGTRSSGARGRTASSGTRRRAAAASKS